MDPMSREAARYGTAIVRAICQPGALRAKTRRHTTCEQTAMRNRRRCRLQISDGDVVIGTAIRYLRVNDAAGPDGLQHSDDAAPLVNFCRRSFERNAQCHCRPARMVVVQAACGEGSTASAIMANPCRSAWAIQPESSSDSIVTTCAINSAGCFSLTRIVRRVRGR